MNKFCFMLRDIAHNLINPNTLFERWKNYKYNMKFWTRMIEVGAYFYHPIWIQHVQEHKFTDFDDIRFSHSPFMN